MSVSAAGAAASGLLSIVATKIVAVLMGPASLALLATLQQLRQTAVTAATCNGQTALVQGASGFEGVARREYLRTVAMIFALATAGTAAALAFAPAAIARWAGLRATDAPLVRWLAVAMALSSLFVFLSGVLNALGAIAKLAILQVAGPAAMALLAWPAARGLPFPAMLAISAAATVTGGCFALGVYRGTLYRWFQGSRPVVRQARGAPFLFHLHGHAGYRPGCIERTDHRAWKDFARPRSGRGRPVRRGLGHQHESGYAGPGFAPDLLPPGAGAFDEPLKNGESTSQEC